ncbi:4595_t:CDS:2 [Entrophospora sp. SA101]|nr:4595_t:CDS:2 [Entrophospora sp. SA101]
MSQNNNKSYKRINRPEYYKEEIIANGRNLERAFESEKLFDELNVNSRVRGHARRGDGKMRGAA